MTAVIRHILFDLDGTLLPMDQEEFVRYYMPMLAEAYISRGIPVEPGPFIDAVWKGYQAMVENDGSCTNEEAFWNYTAGTIPVERAEAVRIAEEFYGGEFNRAASVCRPAEAAARIVKTAMDQGTEVYLATNPVFPRCATMNRIRWAGLRPEDFRIITTYEDCRYCKPNVRYFQEILEKFGLAPEECLMVGNDVEEDLAVRSLGVSAFLVTDCLENKKQLPIETEYMGTLQECLEFISAMPSGGRETAGSGSCREGDGIR